MDGDGGSGDGGSGDGGSGDGGSGDGGSGDGGDGGAEGGGDGGADGGGSGGQMLLLEVARSKVILVSHGCESMQVLHASQAGPVQRLTSQTATLHSSNGTRL